MVVFYRDTAIKPHKFAAYDRNIAVLVTWLRVFRSSSISHLKILSSPLVYFSHFATISSILARGLPNLMHTFWTMSSVSF